MFSDFPDEFRHGIPVALTAGLVEQHRIMGCLDERTLQVVSNSSTGNSRSEQRRTLIVSVKGGRRGRGRQPGGPSDAIKNECVNPLRHPGSFSHAVQSEVCRNTTASSSSSARQQRRRWSRESRDTCRWATEKKERLGGLGLRCPLCARIWWWAVSCEIPLETASRRD